MPYADDLRGFSEPPSGSYFPALAAMSGMQQAPPLAQFEGGDHLRQGMPPQQVRGPIQAIKDAFTPRQDEQGNPKADSLMSILNAALMVVPGMRGPRGAVMAAEKGAGSGGGSPKPAAPSAKELIDASGNRTQFDGVLEQYRTLPSAQLKQIAGDFLGYSPNAKSRAELIDTMRRKHRQDELNTDRSAAQLKIKPMERDVIERGRSGRPNRTEPLGIGNEDRIIDAAMNWKPKPAAPVKPSTSTQSAFDSLQQVAHDATDQGTKSLLGLDKPPPSQTHSQYIEQRAGKMSRPEFLESDALWGMARDLAAQKKMPLSRAFNELANPALVKKHGGPLTAEELSNMGLGAAQHGIGPSRHGGWD